VEEIEEDEDYLGRGLALLGCSVRRGHPLGIFGWELTECLRIVIDIVATGQLTSRVQSGHHSLPRLVELAYGTARHRNLRTDLRMTS